MPTETDIILEDGTVWDGSDPEEPSLCRRLQLCESCRSLMASPERIRALRLNFGIPMCTASGEEGGAPCAMRAMVLRGVETWNKEKWDRIRWMADSNYMRQLLEHDFGEWMWLRATAKKGAKDDVESLNVESSGKDMTRFEVLALPGDPAAEYVTTRPAMADVANESGAQIKSWMDTCRREHSKCLKATNTTLPTRILDVEPDPDRRDNIRIYETRGEMGRYIALSYCWGGPQPVLLKRHTHEQMTGAAGIELSQLPLTIQDAVRVTRDLGLRYLWVDALCIIQDSREDMKHELTQMASVFKNAYITISAASARTCQDGFLQHRIPRRSQFPRFELPYRAWEDGPAGTVILQEAVMYYAFEEPINLRAWCLQESLLSPRLVTFGKHELIWQCGAVSSEEPLMSGGSGESFMQGMQRLETAFFNPAEPLSPSYWEMSWSDVVINYSQRKMTYEEDKLVALAALAAEHQRLSDGDEYVAGLWGRDLARWLSWIVDPSPSADRINGVQTLQPRPSTYVAPSWSWASVHGVVSYAINVCGNPRCEVLRYEVSLLNESLPMGAVTRGLLELRVQLRETRWSVQTLFEDTGAESKPIGKAFMDADEEKPEVVTCLGMYSRSGIMVVRKSPTTYARVGWFEMREMKLDDWLAGCEFETITLV